MACNDEVTVLEQQAPAGIDSSQTAVRGDEMNLYGQIDRDKIFGLNLADPTTASVCIKPWDRRNDMTDWTESGVDDQVSAIIFANTVLLNSRLVVDHYHSFHCSCTHQIYPSQYWTRRLCPSTHSSICQQTKWGQF